MAEKLRLFASRPARRKGTSKLSPKLEIPPLFACKALACRVGNRGGLGPSAAGQLEEKLRAQCHALPRTRLSSAIDQRDRCGGVTDTDQEDRGRAVEGTVSGKQRIPLPIFAPCSRRIPNAGKHRRGRGPGPGGPPRPPEQRNPPRTVSPARRGTDP